MSDANALLAVKAFSTMDISGTGRVTWVEFFEKVETAFMSCVVDSPSPTTSSPVDAVIVVEEEEEEAPKPRVGRRGSLGR